MASKTHMAKNFVTGDFLKFGLAAIDVDAEFIPFAALCEGVEGHVALYFDAELGKAVHVQSKSWRFADVADAYDDFALFLERLGSGSYLHFVAPAHDGSQLGVLLCPEEGKAYVGSVANLHNFFGVTMPYFDGPRPGVPWRELEAVICAEQLSCDAMESATLQ